MLTELANKTGYDYKIVLFCSADDEIFKFEIQYDIKSGELMKTTQSRTSTLSQTAHKESASYRNFIKVNKERLNLQNINRPVSRDEFLEKVNDIPLFTNLIRVETFYRDIKYVGLKPKVPTVPITIFFTVKRITVFFKFD